MCYYKMRDLYAGMKLRTSEEEVPQECVYPQRKPCTCLLRFRLQGLLFFFLKIYENVWHLRLGFCLLKWTVSEPFLVKLHALFTTVPIKAFSVRYELELHVLVFEIFSFWFVVIRKSKWRAHFLLIRKIGEIIKIKPFFESEKGRYLSIFYQTKASRVNTVAYQT